MRRILFSAFALIVCQAAPVHAQAQTPDLLALVPSDFGFCVAVHDLRTHWQRIEQAPWTKAFKQSPLGEALLNTQEFRELTKFQREVQQHLGIDWPTVRDDILGDAIVLAYRPAETENKGEQGLLLVKPRQPQVLKGLIDRLNDLQLKAGELKSLDERHHKGVTYYRRVHDKGAPWWYALHGSVFALASNEATLQAVIERPAKPASVRRDLNRAGAQSAAVALWLDPRFFDAELAAKGKQALEPGADLLKSFLGNWKALDGVVVALDVKDDIELRLSLLAVPGQAKDWMTRRAQHSALWQRLPENSIFTLAGRTNFRELADGLLELAPEGIRKIVVEVANRNIGTALQLNLFEDVLPNLGPDWGVCVLPASAGKEFPQAIFALAVQPGKKKPGVDRSLYNALQFFAGLAVYQFNVAHQTDVKIETLHQDKVEIKYLVGERTLPPGFQPALALKDGFLLVATSPAAIAEFRPATNQTAGPGDDVAMLRVAPSELAQLVRHHRKHVVEQMIQKSGQPKAAAEQHLDTLLGLLDLCRTVTLSQRTGDEQLAWIVRFRMNRGSTP